MFGNYQVFEFPRLRAIGLTQQAVARHQHSSAALCGTASSVHWLAEYGRNHALALVLPHANGRSADLTSASVTGSTRKKADVRSLSLFVCTACSPQGCLYFSYGISTLSLRLYAVLATRPHSAILIRPTLTQILSVMVDRVKLLTCARSAILKSDKIKVGCSLST